MTDLPTRARLAPFSRCGRRAWSLVVVPLALLGTIRAPTSAQTREDLAVVDSAAVARAAWARGVAAFGASDLPGARREIARAAGAWPTQAAYVWGLAVVSARMADTVGARDALRAYAALGLGRDLRADSTFAALLALPDFRAISAAHEANRADLSRSTVRATAPDSTFWPEGMDYDPLGGAFYLASVRHGTILGIEPDGRTRELLSRHLPNVGAVLGVRVDTVRRVLWATTSGIPQREGYQPQDSAIAALLRVSLRDGSVERRWDLPPVEGGHVLGDLAVAPNGDVYVTDSNQPVVYRLKAGEDTLAMFTSKLFRSLQGVAPTTDARTVYLADYSHGLMRLDPTTGEVTRLRDAEGSTSLGCDGIAFDHGAIIAVQNGVTPARLMRFVLDATGSAVARAEVLDRNTSVADEPTIGAIVGDSFVYVANSQWEKYDERGARRPGVPLTAPILLAVPLRASR